MISKEKSASGDLYRAIQKQRPKMYQGIFIVDPDANVLANQGSTPKDRRPWARDFRAQVDESVRAYGGVTPRPPGRFTALKDRGIGVRADGGIVLAVSLRHLALGLDRRGFSEPAHDSISLTREERTQFGRPNAKVGATWKVAASAARNLHKVLSPSSDPNTLPRADEVTFARLQGKVERVSGGVAYLRYTGRITGIHIWEYPPHKGKEINADVKLGGVGTCDAKTGDLLSIILVGEGDYVNFPPYNRANKYGAVVEWKAR